MFMEIKIEPAKKEDARRLLDIYTPYILNTAITFEYTIPTLEEFEQRIENTLIKYPYLVAKKDDLIVGYAYTSAFKNRAAYDWAVETSIYIDMNYRGLGIGKLLYDELEKITKLQNILNMNACIAIPDEGSVIFHKKMGYLEVAYFHQCGYKFDKWYDMIWMEKIVGEHTLNPPKVIPFSLLDYFN